MRTNHLLLALLVAGVAAAAFGAEVHKAGAPPAAIPTFATDDLSRSGIF